MHATATLSRRTDGHLWMIALALSLLVNLALLALAGIATLELRKKRAQVPTTPAPAENESVAMIYPQTAAEVAAEIAAARQRFARTSPDQAGPPAENPAFIGERNTRAASDRTPVADAPPLPSQDGITPRDEMDIETTESEYQDGELVAEASPAAPSPTAAPPATPVPEIAQSQPAEASAAAPPPREQLLEGPNPVDVPVPRESAEAETKPKQETAPASESPPPTPAKPETSESPPATAAADASPKPAFRGNQRKTAVVGSISRTGRSSLDVEDSPLGRYQAAISRAVELEWQRNCVRHRDFITPGFLTVRFFVEASGRVRSVQFVGDMETGEVQKGFTLNSIRDAAIPPMPPALRREYDEEPLELIFRFYF